VVVYRFLGAQVWWAVLGLPFLVFAWLWSLLVYIFHYHTSLGGQTRFNVRRLARHWLYSWLWLNFNEHATHHMYPNIPWFDLPDRRRELPDAHHALNQNTESFWQAIVQQLRGPTVVYRRDANPAPQLFVRWED
jgi:fatty acid desaturase